jgi:hypothetical protein
MIQLKEKDAYPGQISHLFLIPFKIKFPALTFPLK